MKEITNFEQVKVICIPKDDKHWSVELTVLQVQNLNKLADFLENNAARIQAYFSMSCFGLYHNNDVDPDRAFYLIENECGTVACAAGHGPAAGIGHRRDMDVHDWQSYCVKHFGLGLEGDRAGWQWCFAGDWHIMDNSATGAAKRIRYMLNNGVPMEYNPARGSLEASWDERIYM